MYRRDLAMCYLSHFRCLLLFTYLSNVWGLGRESNPQPTNLEDVALPIELPKHYSTLYYKVFIKATLLINICMRYILWMVLMFAPLSLTAHSSGEFLDLIDSTKKAVVYIVNTVKDGTTQTGPATPFSKPKEESDEPLDIKPRQRRATGTGFIVAGGYIITNWHVIENAKKIEVFFENERIPYVVTIVGSDQAIDIAVLKPGPNFPTDIIPLEWRSKTLRQGEEVWTVGHPMGFTYSISKGIISHLDRRIVSPWQPTLQVDAAINQGNSGGPLMDMDGKVVGINVMLINPDSATFAGLGLSIDYKVAKRAAATLIEHGKIVRPLMGVSLTYDEETYKVVAQELSEDGAAKIAGIEEGDLYLEVNDEVIVDINNVFDILALKKPGDVITVKILRNGEVMIFNVTLTSRPAELDDQ